MKEFISYLDSRIEEGRSEITALTVDGRTDDANFAKVRTNIYDVCRSVINTLINRPGAGRNAIAAQLERFRATWGAALEKARLQGSAKETAVGENKLAALEEIISRFGEAF